MVLSLLPSTVCLSRHIISDHLGTLFNCVVIALGCAVHLTAFLRTWRSFVSAVLGKKKKCRFKNSQQFRGCLFLTVCPLVSHCVQDRNLTKDGTNNDLRRRLIGFEEPLALSRAFISDSSCSNIGISAQPKDFFFFRLLFEFFVMLCHGTK